jgi:hypothetical protein
MGGPREGKIGGFMLARLLDAAAAADILAWVNSGFSVDASVRITLLDRAVPSCFQSLEHLLRNFARPPFSLERLSVIRGADGRISRTSYLPPRQGGGHATEGCCNAQAKPRSHDTSRTSLGETHGPGGGGVSP